MKDQRFHGEGIVKLLSRVALKPGPIVLLGIALQGLLACGPSSNQNSKLVESESQPRPVAEYEATRALLMGTGWGRSMVANKDKLGLGSRELEEIIRGNEEHVKMIDTIVRSQPKLSIFLHAFDEGLEMGEYELWQPMVEAWNRNGASIDLFKVKPEDFPGVPADQLSDDNWTRDYGSFTVEVGNQMIDHGRAGRGQYVNRTIAEKLGRPVREASESFEGGAVMMTSDRICAHSGGQFTVLTRSILPPHLAGVDRIFFEDFGCDSLIKVPPLPNEGTRHIDLFAKFLNDRTVLVVDYASDDIRIENEAHEFSYSCDAKDIDEKSWSDCELSPTIKDFPLASEDLFIKNESDLKALLEVKLPGASVDYKHGRMKEHLAQTKTLFEAQGFEVVSLSNPMPSAILNLDSYRNAKGDRVHQEVRLTFVHRSYANSLISNGQLYLPTYQEFPELNQAAQEVYQKLGFKVHDIDMTETIKRGGAVHCLTKDLH